MAEEGSSRVFYNPDGYVEMVLVGRVSAAELQGLARQTTGVVTEHGQMGGLIDGRVGNIVRNFETIRTMQDLQLPQLKRLVILTDPQNPIGIRKPSVIMSILTTLLGFRPIYLSDEDEARALASAP